MESTQHLKDEKIAKTAQKVGGTEDTPKLTSTFCLAK